jgi:hypothetical protein
LSARSRLRIPGVGQAIAESLRRYEALIKPELQKSFEHIRGMLLESSPDNWDLEFAGIDLFDLIGGVRWRTWPSPDAVCDWAALQWSSRAAAIASAAKAQPSSCPGTSTPRARLSTASRSSSTMLLDAVSVAYGPA